MHRREPRETFRCLPGIVLADHRNVLRDAKPHLPQPLHRLYGLGIVVGNDGRHVWPAHHQGLDRASSILCQKDQILVDLPAKLSRYLPVALQSPLIPIIPLIAFPGQKSDRPMSQLDQVVERNASLLVMIVSHRADRHIRPIAAQHNCGDVPIQSLDDGCAVPAQAWSHEDQPFRQ